MPSLRDRKYQIQEEEVKKKSPLAKQFLDSREGLNKLVADSSNKLIHRFLNLDHNTYLEGKLSAHHKELIGLSVSTALRCDDCIYYHLIQAYRLGLEKVELVEAMQIALTIGGSITIPHMRRAFALLDELYR